MNDSLDNTAKFNIVDGARRDVMIAKIALEQARDDLERAQNALKSATNRLETLVTGAK